MTRSLALALLALALLPATSYGSQDSRNGRIAWSRITLDGSAIQIVTARPDGSDLRVLTPATEGASDLDPKWSPDGRRIVFDREFADGTVQIVIIDAGGGRERRFDAGCTDPCFSDQTPTWGPDSRHIAFTRVMGPFDAPGDGPRSATLWTARDDGTHARRLSPPGIEPAYDDNAALWSRDRSYIQFLRGRGDPRVEHAIFRMRPDGTGVRQLTPWELDADEPDLSHAASGPSKDLVVFETHGQGGQAQNIATVPATCQTLSACTRKIRYLTSNAADGPTNSTNPAWAPDGSRIALAEWTYPSTEDPGTEWLSDIFTMDPHGHGRQLVSRGPEWNMRPNWGVQPRGWIAGRP
jgi:Tol biopolymer transport system component